MGDHRPTLDGAVVDLTAYTGQIVGGFWRMARLLATHRDELLSPAGPLAAFAQAPVRFLVRKTLAYSNLAFEGQHPYVLGDAVDRDRHLDRLWSAVPETPALERLVAAEHRDLERGDIPMFTTTPGSLDVWTSDGERITGFLSATSLDGVHERLRGLDEAEIARQAWIVTDSLQAMSGRKNSEDRHALRETESAPSRDELVAAAVDVGLRLDAISFRRGEAAFWFAQKFQEGPNPCVLALAGPDLYLGVSGIALFLAHLGAVSGEARFTRLARAATVTLRAQIAHGGTLVPSIGGFSGWGGILYTLTHLGALLAGRSSSRRGRAGRRDAGTADRCRRILRRRRRRRRLPRGSPRPPFSAAIWPGLWISPCAVASASWRALAAWSAVSAGCWSWPGRNRWPASPTVPRGSPGLSSRWPRRRATSAFTRRPERLWSTNVPSSPPSTGWPDLRHGAPTEDHSLCAWCHGAPGIALGRLDSLRFLDDAAMRDDIATAVGATLAGGFGKGHSLCHGDLGNLESLALAAELLDPPGLAGRVGRLAGGVLGSIREHGWRCGVLGRGEMPGLMLGLAGIGYGLLRLAEPERVPSVLRLAPPAPE